MDSQSQKDDAKIEQLYTGGSDPEGVVARAPDNQLQRQLKSRHIGMIAIGGAIGTGLIIGTGSALQRAGPVGILIAYSLVGVVVWFTMTALGEMSTLLPISTGFAGYASRFCSPSLGVATGYNYWFKYIIVVPNQITAASLVIKYWNDDISVAVWISIFIAGIIIINLFGVKLFGEIEFWLSSMKIVVIVGLLLLCIAINCGAGPKGEYLGFRYWKHPRPINEYVNHGSNGRFLAVWSVMVTATFAYLGTELVGVTVGEAENPRKNVPAAIKRTFCRILIFYIGGVFLLGLVVPSDSPELLGANKRKNSAAASPFVVAINLAGIKVLPDILNACILLFILSAANSDLYIASRTLYGLAADGKAPAIFRRTMKNGIPIYALGASAMFSALAYMNLSSSGTTIFGYFVNLVTIFGLLTWISIQISHICFRRALKAQNYDPKSLPYQAPFAPYGTYFALFVSVLIAFFKGWDTIAPKFIVKSFITSYLGIPLFIIIFIGHKLFTRAPMRDPATVDLVSGAREFDDMHEVYLEEKAIHDQKPKNWKYYLNLPVEFLLG